MGNTENNLDDKVKAIKQLLDMFKFERMVYLGITILSLIVLFSCAIYMLSQDKNQMPAVIGMFTSSGGVAYTGGRLLKMWSDAMQLLGSFKTEN